MALSCFISSLPLTFLCILLGFYTSVSAQPPTARAPLFTSANGPPEYPSKTDSPSHDIHKPTHTTTPIQKPITINNAKPPTNQSKSEKSDVCLGCIEFMDNNMSILANIVTKVGIAQTCGTICNTLNNSGDITTCNTLCDQYGSQKFWQIFLSAGINSIYACEMVAACVAGTHPAVSFSSYNVTPATGPQGTAFVLSTQFTVINETGVGEYAFVLYYPIGDDHELGFIYKEIFVDYPIGEYLVNFSFPTNSSFNTGNYLVVFDLCSGACGQDPVPMPFASEEMIFNLTTAASSSTPSSLS